MVNCIDNEKLLRNIITQFCDQNFKFTLNLKILGSIHVQVDNNEVLTCLLDEKFFKSSQNRSLITTNQNLFNPLSVVKPLSDNNTALNLVTTLNQFQQQQQQQQLKLVNPSHLVPTVKTQSLSSSSSTSSKSSTSSYMSGDSKHHKRKRSNDQKSDDGCSSSSASCRSRRENHTDDEEEDDGNSSDHNENENDPENEENLNDSNQTPVKRNKREEVEIHDEAAAAAASALSLISAAAVANKIYNQQNIQPVQTHNFHSIAAHLNPYQGYNSNENEPSPSALPSSSSVQAQNPHVNHKPLKPKSKFIDYEQQLKQQIFQQSIENQNFAHNIQDSEIKKSETNENVDHDSSLEENQLYMDEDNMNKNDKENEEHKPQQINHLTIPQENHMHLQQQQQQHLMMAAAAAALMNNNSVNQPVSNDNPNLKLFMPHSLALNLAAVKQQQAQQMQQLQNGEKNAKKKTKNSNLVSPSANLVPINGPNSNKSTGSTTSCSSSSSTSSTGKQSKKSRQTIAALAAAAAAARTTGAASTNPLTPANQNVDLQKNLVALANQFGLKESSNIDQIINEVTEKSKNPANTPKPNASKHLKKQHLLSASVQNSPNSPNLPKKEKIKKTKAGHFVDSSNIMNQNSIQNGSQMNGASPAVLPNASVPIPVQQAANPAQAAAAAAAAALQYHQFLNNNMNKNINSATPQKPNPKFHLANGGYVEETENQMRHIVKYEDADEEEPCEEDEMKEGQNNHLSGPLSVKSLTGPLMPNNTNTPGQGPNASNLEFECTACEKKFKYYCYYKRHMDACHSDIPKYVCDTCNKSYKWEASFRQHLRSHHTNGQGGLNNEENGECGDGEENNENRAISESGDEMKGINGQHEDEDDEEESESRDQNRMHQNENRNLYYERDHEQIGAAGTLASIAESLNGMHGRLIINNQHMS